MNPTGSRFEDQLAETADRLEAVLRDILSETAGHTPERLIDAMAYGVLGGGKRFRPFLTLAAAAIFEVDPIYAVRAAAAIECIHCYSLIHDDLPAMDNDDLRRGQPTVHIAFDQATAILAGDALLTLAFEILADPRTHPNAEIRTQLAAWLARAAGARGMAGGQMLDLEAENRDYQESEIRRMQALKTGALICVSCETGAIMGEANDQQRAALVAYGEAIGAAFQIKDDLMDIEGDASEVGKATGKDTRLGKATLVAHLGLDQARAELDMLSKDALQAVSIFGDAAEPLRAAARFNMSRTK
ncbi:MAG: polyprenyl synthetase family protein [Fimbriimonadaceae bacterium]|nr:polyprenyl synthetase family protein [Alphaproteobacteria bacterium]